MGGLADPVEVSVLIADREARARPRERLTPARGANQQRCKWRDRERREHREHGRRAVPDPGSQLCGPGHCASGSQPPAAEQRHQHHEREDAGEPDREDQSEPARPRARQDRVQQRRQRAAAGRVDLPADGGRAAGAAVAVLVPSRSRRCWTRRCRSSPPSCWTALPAPPDAASCRLVFPGSVPPVWWPPLPLPGPEVGWLQPTPGTTSTYWFTPELPGGAHVAATAAAGSDNATAAAAVASGRVSRCRIGTAITGYGYVKSRSGLTDPIYGSSSNASQCRGEIAAK